MFQYALIEPTRKSPVPVGRAAQEELLRPALEAVPGVAEVVSVGEIAQQPAGIGPAEQ